MRPWPYRLHPHHRPSDSHHWAIIDRTSSPRCITIISGKKTRRESKLGPNKLQTTTNRRTPIGRELSTNAQSSDAQIQMPATGSQKGVEQLAGTGSACRVRPTTTRRTKRKGLTSEPRLLTLGDLLRRVRVRGRGLDLWTAVLIKDIV